MQCPNDGTVLIMSERQGVEVDYCPACRGVWLDRGELDKIIDRSNELLTPRSAQLPPSYPQEKHSHDKDYHKKHKRESFLSDLFDF